MKTTVIHHDRNSLAAASAYYQTLLLQRCGLVALGLYLWIRFAMWLSIHVLHVHTPSSVHAPETAIWLSFIAGTLLVLAVIYRGYATVKFKTSQALSDQRAWSLMRGVLGVGNPFLVETNGHLVDWDPDNGTKPGETHQEKEIRP